MSAMLTTLMVLASVSVADKAWAQEQNEETPTGYARLLVITNFENTEVQINDVSYPYEYIYAEREGVILPSDMTFLLRVSVSPQQTRTFRLRLEEGETRVIVVDIENMGESAPSRPSRRSSDDDDEEEEEEEDEDEAGYLGVSSSPRGIVHVDGESTGRRTPARRIELEPGRHRVQIFYESEEEMSETKHVLIRAGTNTNVFFRHRD
jgi:hypothetical protein